MAASVGVAVVRTEAGQAVKPTLQPLGWPEAALGEGCQAQVAALAVTEPGFETSLKWATIKGAAGAFQMLVHAQNDIVSGHLLSSGAWEGVTRAVLCLFPCGDVMCCFG